MERKHNDLWVGGPWEQPSRTVPPSPAMSQVHRPVLRVKRRRRKLLPVLITVAVILSLVLAGMLIWYFDLLPNVRFERFYGGDFPFPYLDEDFDHREQTHDYSTPPAIPAAATGTGVTITLERGEESALSYEEIYNLCAPSIVSITTVSSAGANTGTGIVLTQDGYVLTNAHVVSGGNEVEVVTFDNRMAHARLVGFDAAEDLAVLKVDMTGLTPARFGDSNELKSGQQVAAIGDSLGYRSTITDGIISALDREVEVDDVTMTLIQTSAAINFGNSGGALIDRFGRVVGITTIKIVSGDGSAESMGFAIPSVRVKYVADRLIDGQTIIPGVLGITVNTLPVEGLGLEIISVTSGSDAEKKGLRPGDILLQVDGVDLTGVQILSRAKIARGAGDTMVLTVAREGQSFDVEVMLTDPSQLEGY